MIVTVDQMKEQLGITDDLGTDDDALITRKIKAAQDHVERLLGFKVEDTFGGEGQDEIPDSLVEAVSQLAAHYYENREATIVGVSAEEIPFSVREVVREYRQWSF
jgi:uncharacterized phage protein (predicted DNA packaging)